MFIQIVLNSNAQSRTCMLTRPQMANYQRNSKLFTSFKPHACFTCVLIMLAWLRWAYIMWINWIRSHCFTKLKAQAEQLKERNREKREEKKRNKRKLKNESGKGSQSWKVTGNGIVQLVFILVLIVFFFLTLCFRRNQNI